MSANPARKPDPQPSNITIAYSDDTPVDVATNGNHDQTPITENAIYGIMIDGQTEPSERLKAVTDLLTFSPNRDASVKNLREFNDFKEYLQIERKKMAQSVIALTDTDVFGELRDVLEDINVSLMGFEKEITPLTEIVDAVYTLRTNGATFDVFAELLKEREEEKARRAQISRLSSEMTRSEEHVKTLRGQIAKLETQRTFFGMGGISRSAQSSIEANRAQMVNLTERLQDLAKEINTLSEQPPENPEFSKFSREKAKLRELLDISSQEHKAQQSRLVESAQDFIESSENRVDTVLQHFERLNAKIDGLQEANFVMRNMYAILNDAAKEVTKVNEDIRQNLKSEIETAESELTRLQWQRQERDINTYISNLGRSNVDTTTVLAELTSAEHRIQAMREANDQQIARTRQLHTSGVASVADKLSTVLHAVSAAALGESSEAAKLSLDRMNRTTSALGHREVIRMSLNSREVNQDLNRALSDLSDYTETIRTATEITREGLSETKTLLSQIETQTAETHRAVKESMNVTADVAADIVALPPSEKTAQLNGA